MFGLREGFGPPSLEWRRWVAYKQATDWPQTLKQSSPVFHCPFLVFFAHSHHHPFHFLHWLHASCPLPRNLLWDYPAQLGTAYSSSTETLYLGHETITISVPPLYTKLVIWPITRFDFSFNTYKDEKIKRQKRKVCNKQTNCINWLSWAHACRGACESPFKWSAVQFYNCTLVQSNIQYLNYCCNWKIRIPSKSEPN